MLISIDIDPIITDINDMPDIHIRFVKGSELLKEYPKAIIPFKKREEFFYKIASIYLYSGLSLIISRAF